MGKIKAAIIIMCLNLPSCEVKNQLTFYKVRWFKYSFVIQYIQCFKNFWGSGNTLLHIPLKMENKMKNILILMYSLKLKNIILFLTRGSIFIFFKWSYSQRCFDVAQRCKFQRWRTQRCFNVDLMLYDIATSHHPKNNVQSTFKCLLG